ncbi:quinone oxidoreductase family protein [Streptomyces avicenniae]|uniref:quinone oxidoreductase family protein n=1 Tax=Streptomyces avicenniae TaxID=500153 RepID=UPI00069C581F|nr:NADP-dependent oxidoreductase [Streptomyces avicenniae]
MRAVAFERGGAPEVLTVVELPEPTPGPGEIRVRVHGAGVNPADTLLRAEGSAVTAFPGPHVLGMDVAGVVDGIGPGTETSLSLGDRVMAVVLPVRPEGGGYAERVVVPAGWAVAVPEGISPHEAATVPMNALTVLSAFEAMDLAGGETAGVTGAAGAFGGAFVQLAAVRGIRTVADAAPKDDALLRELGATWVVRRGADVAERMREVVPQGVDALVDGALLGPRVLPAVRDGGRYASLRKLGEAGTQLLPSPAPRGISYRTFGVHEWFGRADLMDEIARALAAGRLTPRVAEVVPPGEAARAHATLEAGGVRGRFVLDFS